MTTPVNTVSAQYVCVGCGCCFMLRDLFVIAEDNEEKEMRCLSCFYDRIFAHTHGNCPDLATFHEMIGGPAVENMAGAA